MKTVITSDLPKKWSNNPSVKGLVAEWDVGILASSIKAKVLVFNNSGNLRHFWKHALSKGELGKGCRGAVNSMRIEIIKFEKDQPIDLDNIKPTKVEVDKNYFCIMGLVQGYLNTNVITHESIHAAFCYDVRLGKKNRFRETFEDDVENMGFQEGIAYPAGFIADEITKLVKKHKLS